MSDLIHKIVGKIIEVGQSDTTKFRLGETIRYSPSEILEILKQHESEIFSEEKTINDLISRQAAIDRINKQREHLQPDIYPQDIIGDAAYRICAEFIERLPSAQPLDKDTNVPCTDTISRQDVIDAFYLQSDDDGWWCGTAEDMETLLKGLPSAQPDLDEWCTDCKEYDSEKHCCPRFNRVIRNALKDAQPKIIRCGECRHYRTCEIFGKKITLCKRREYDALSVEPDDFCSYAERKEQDDG